MYSHQKRYAYSSYTLIAPVALGVMNVLAVWLSNRYKINRRTRYLRMSLIAPSAVALFAYLTKAYTFTWQGWVRYTGILFLIYFFVCNIVLYELDRNV